MTTAQLPDGTQLNFPDGTDPAVIQATVKKVLAQQPQGETAAQATARMAENDKSANAPQETGPLHALKLTGSAIGRGLASIGGLVLDGADQLGSDPAYYGKHVMEKSAALQNLGEQPQTEAEKYYNSAVQGAAGALVPGGAAASIPRTLMTGAVSGLGAEAGQELTKDQSPRMQLAATLAGGLGGGLAGSAAGSLSRTGPSLIREATRDTSEEALQSALRNMTEIRDSGLGTVNASQAMTQPSGLDKLAAMLANSKYGKATQSQLRAQPSQVAIAGEDAAAQLPGMQGTANDTANAVQSAATDTIQGAKDARTKVWQDTLAKGVKMQTDAAQARLAAARKVVADQEASMPAGQTPNPRGPARVAAMQELVDAQRAVSGASRISGEAVQEESGRLAGLANDRPNTAAGSLLGKLANQLVDSKGRPLTDPTQINDALKTMSSSLKDPNLGTAGVDAGTVKFVQSQIDQVRKNLGARFQPIKDANDAYSSYTDSVINPMKQSVTGRMSGIAGYDPAKEAPVTKLQNLFDKGTVPGGPSDILTLEKSLRSTPGGSKAYADGFKTWVTGKLSSALAGSDNRTPDTVASTLTRVFGDPAQATTASQGTKDMLVGLARSQGMNAEDTGALVNGFQQFQRFAAAAARRPGSVGDSTRDLSAASGQLSPRINPLAKGLEVVGNLRGASAMRFADKLMTTPEGLATLIKLSRQPVMSQAAANTIATFAATASTADETPGH